MILIERRKIGSLSLLVAGRTVWSHGPFDNYTIYPGKLKRRNKIDDEGFHTRLRAGKDNG